MPAGFSNDTMYAANMDLTGAINPSPTMLTDGQMLIAHTALNVGGTHIDVGMLTSPGATITIGYVSPNITLDISGGTFAVEHLTGNSGGQLNPTANNFNTLGTGSITIAGLGSTLTTQLTGLTNHAVLVGAGTATITKIVATANTGAVLQNNSGADPSYSTATYPSTTTINQILFSSSANTVAGLTAANSALLVSSSAGVPVWSASMTNGQIIVGSTGATPAAATLTSSDSSITFTTGAGTLSLQVAGGTTVGKTITGDSGGALSPTAGNWNIVGSTVVAGTAPLVTSGSGSTLTVKAQRAQALASADSTKVGLANFSSADFTVDANGFVALAGTAGAAIQTITGNSGGAEVPSSGNFNILGTGSITAVGSANTETIQLTGITNHAIQIGAGTATLTQLAATATTGQILQNNASADPSYSTATYPSTTTVSQVLYSSSTNVVAGLTTANNGLLVTSNTGVPSILAGPGATGKVLQSNSAAAPSFSTATYPSTATGTGTILRADGTNWVATTATYPNTAGTSGNVLTSDGTNWNSTAPTQFNALTGQIFTASGAFTYTPTSGMKYVIVELLGGGAGGGGVATTAGAQTSVSASGSGGGYVKFILTAAQVGASKTGSVGVGGAGGAAGNNAGTNGGNTTLATSSAWTASGGVGGAGGAAVVTAVSVPATTAGSNTTGTGTLLVNKPGNASEGGGSFTAGTSVILAGKGADSFYGQGGNFGIIYPTGNVTNAGNGAVGFGAGGGAAINYGTATQAAGGAGTTGIAIFTEFS